MIFDLEWPRMTLKSTFLKSWCQELHFDIWFADFASVLKFDPKWPQICNLTPNSIFFSWNNSQISLIILSYYSIKLIESAARSQKKAKIVDFRKNDPVWPRVTLDEIWHRQCFYHIKLHINWSFHDSSLYESSWTNF